MIILPSGTYFDAATGGRWDTLRNLIEEARGLDDLPPNHLRIDRYTTSRWDDLEASGLLGERAAGVAGPGPRPRAGDRPPPAPLPAGFRAELRGYQQDGLRLAAWRCTTADSAASWPTTWAWARPCRRSG